MNAANRLDMREIKRDKNLLLAYLEIKDAGNSCKCPFHNDRTGSMSVGMADNGNWTWNCKACGFGGTIFDAVMKKRNLREVRDAVHFIAKELGIAIREEKPRKPPPVLNVSKAEKLVNFAHENLLSNIDLLEEYAVGKRGIRNLDTIKKFRLGFLTGASFREWNSWKITGWTIPVTDYAGKIVAVKIHNEFKGRPEMPKCLWAPFGMRSASAKPGETVSHGYACFYPPPETWKGHLEIFICPGELKALALISAGFAAIAPTCGEGSTLHEDEIEKVAMIVRDGASKGHDVNIYLVFDDEESKKRADGTRFNPGREWLDRMQKALFAEGIVAKEFSYKRVREVLLDSTMFDDADSASMDEELSEVPESVLSAADIPLMDGDEEPTAKIFTANKELLEEVCGGSDYVKPEITPQELKELKLIKTDKTYVCAKDERSEDPNADTHREIERMIADFDPELRVKYPYIIPPQEYIDELEEPEKSKAQAQLDKYAREVTNSKDKRLAPLPEQRNKKEFLREM